MGGREGNLEGRENVDVALQVYGVGKEFLEEDRVGDLARAAELEAKRIKGGAVSQAAARGRETMQKRTRRSNSMTFPSLVTTLLITPVFSCSASSPVVGSSSRCPKTTSTPNSPNRLLISASTASE